MAIMDAIKKVFGSKEEPEEPNEQNELDYDQLEEWKKKLEQAMTYFNTEIMDEREYIYLGTRSVDKNVNSRQQPSKYANTVYNIVFEFIETQINMQIPQPSVKSVREGFEDQARMVEDAVTDKLKQMDTEYVTDLNERITPVQGYSIMELCWNNDKTHQLYTGDMELYSRHPKQFVIQPGMFRLKNMDYAFVLSKVTPNFVLRRYGVDLSNQTEEYPENTSLYGITPTQTSVVDHTLTEIVAWYCDEDGDIGKFTWINDTVLENLPKYYYRRDEEGNILEKETLVFPTEIGSRDEYGNPIVLPVGTEVPYYVPKCYPFSIRRNVPKNFDFGGQSDLDVIRDHQDSIKKVVTKMEEKIIKAGSIVKVEENHNVAITDQVYQVVKGTMAQLSALGVENLEADIDKDVEYIQTIYKQAQSMLGITDSFQGKEDSSAKSGVAKQIQVQQASGRLLSKAFNKNSAFKDLFQLMFEFMLAFYDEPRPYLAQDAYGKPQYKEFDKYKFLMMDDAGELYYNTDFLFSADPADHLPQDRVFLFNTAKEMLQSGALDQMQFWQILDGMGFPMAKQILEQLERRQQAEMKQAQMAAEAQANGVNQLTPDQMLQSLPEDQREKFSQLPPEEQAAIMAQIGGAA